MAVFDISTPVRVKGTVIQIDYINPHPVIYLNEETEDGQVLRWSVESSATLNIFDRGRFDRSLVHVGDTIEACGYLPKLRPASVDGGRSPGAPGSRATWLDNPDRTMTGRLLLLPGGPQLHWSHYGPLDQCISEEELDALTH